MKPLRFGVLGLGFMGQIHTANLGKLPGLSLEAVSDPDREKVEEHGGEGIKAYTDAALLDHPGLEAVILCLPTPMHEAVTEQALGKGLAVLCEKPIALDLASAERMIRAAETAGKLFMVGHCLRFWPEYRYLRNLVTGGELGRLLSLNLWRMSERPAWSWNNWLLDPGQSGGPLVDLHIHDADWILYLLGQPDRVFATARRTGAFPGDDILHVQYDYAQGPQVHLHAGWCPGNVPFNAGYEAWFEKGFVRFTGAEENPLQVYEEGKEATTPTDVPTGDAYEEELLYFAGCLRTGSPPDECSPKASRDSLGLVLRTMTSVETGRVQE